MRRMRESRSLVMADQDYAEIWDYIEERVKRAVEDYFMREGIKLEGEDGIALDEDIENLCDGVARDVVQFANSIPKVYVPRTYEESIQPGKRKWGSREDDLYRSNIDYYDDIEIPEGSQDEDIYYKPEPAKEKKHKVRR